MSAWSTAWGPMGAVASPHGICRVVLPHYQMNDLLDLLSWEHPGATRDDGAFAELIYLTRDYFNGRVVDFQGAACDLPSEKTFEGKVYRACREIPYGRTVSYSQLALSIGREDAARAVAAALGRNPIPLAVPCHRVTYADGRLGGFSAPGGEAMKRRMLQLESRAVGKTQ